VVGGDVVSGPMPRETLELLLAVRTSALFVRGNADREVAGGEGGVDVAWTAGELTEEQRRFLTSRAETVSLEIDGLGATLFCHGSPRSDEEIVTAASPDERVRPMLAGVEEEVVVCGHTHVQFDRAVAGKRVVNAGSVGMPYQDEPGAYWALLGPGVELRRTAYDGEQAAERIRATDFPGADEFAAENVLTRPGAAEATEHFERLAERAGES
jgi:predicted phosphodiesterase